MIGLNSHKGKRLDGLSHLHQSIRDILTTRRGTRVMRRDYGSRLPELVDNPALFKICVETYPASPIPAQPRNQFAEFCATPLLSSV